MRTPSRQLGDIVGFYAYSFAVGGRLPGRDELRFVLRQARAAPLLPSTSLTAPAGERTGSQATGGDPPLPRTPADASPATPSPDPAHSAWRDPR
jgi:hypothetical protein